MNPWTTKLNQVRIRLGDHHWRRVYLHWVAILFETTGTFFLALDVHRVNSMIRILGNASFDGEPQNLRAWYFHGVYIGFAMIYAGILLAGLALLLEHKAMVEAESKR